jgi:hypothetical protein
MFRSRPSPGDVSLSFAPVTPASTLQRYGSTRTEPHIPTEVAYGGLYAVRLVELFTRGCADQSPMNSTCGAAATRATIAVSGSSCPTHVIEGRVEIGPAALPRFPDRPSERSSSRSVRLRVSQNGGTTTRSRDGTNAAQHPAGRGRPPVRRTACRRRAPVSTVRWKAKGGWWRTRPSGHREDRGPPEGVTVVLFGGREVRCASLELHCPGGSRWA